MSDYISKDETISTIWNVFNSYGNSAVHFEVEETKAIRKFCSRLQREIELLPTVDEKEIIRKPMERAKEKLDKELMEIDKKRLRNFYSDEALLEVRGFETGIRYAYIEIRKESGISE